MHQLSYCAIFVLVFVPLKICGFARIQFTQHETQIRMQCEYWVPYGMKEESKGCSSVTPWDSDDWIYRDDMERRGDQRRCRSLYSSCGQCCVTNEQQMPLAAAPTAPQLDNHYSLHRPRFNWDLHCSVAIHQPATTVVLFQSIVSLTGPHQPLLWPE